MKKNILIAFFLIGLLVLSKADHDGEDHPDGDREDSEDEEYFGCDPRGCEACDYDEMCYQCKRGFKLEEDENKCERLHGFENRNDGVSTTVASLNVIGILVVTILWMRSTSQNTGKFEDF
jgi:hypothetical protein